MTKISYIDDNLDTPEDYKDDTIPLDLSPDTVSEKCAQGGD
jgi:hypothetical protein